jgi:hypothetical protein
MSVYFTFELVRCMYVCMYVGECVCEYSCVYYIYICALSTSHSPLAPKRLPAARIDRSPTTGVFSWEVVPTHLLTIPHHTVEEYGGDRIRVLTLLRR